MNRSERAEGIRKLSAVVGRFSWIWPGAVLCNRGVGRGTCG